MNSPHVHLWGQEPGGCTVGARPQSSAPVTRSITDYNVIGTTEDLLKLQALVQPRSLNS
jgi:hypothetical protein